MGHLIVRWFLQVYRQKTLRIMRLSRYRKLIVATLVITFPGQVLLAADMSCHDANSSGQTHEQAMDVALPEPELAGSTHMDHSMHTNMDSASVMPSSDCCPDCDCYPGSCSTAVLPTCEMANATRYSYSISQYSELTEYALTTPLFRPPIPS